MNTEIYITKRDGKREAFSIDKIKSAVAKAFLSVGSFATQETMTGVLSRLNISNGMTVEEIQNQVEVALMAEQYFSVAKSFMIYRQKRFEDREVRDKLRFLIDYCNATNPATGSKYDANANVENKNIATLIGELPKSNFIRLNRKLLTDKIKQMYGKEVSDKYLDLLNRHFIYKNDETSLANYCASITMYPWLLSGTLSIGGNSTRPTNLKSFCGGFINMVFMVSSMLSGACATPEFLMYLNYFIGKEYGNDYFLRADKVVDLSKKQRTLDKVITDCFEQIVYSINQPTGARNFQAVFWNIAYYDKYYFESLFGNFVFPDGDKPDWDSLDWLQQRFMRWFNAERTKAVLTFPVDGVAVERRRRTGQRIRKHHRQNVCGRTFVLHLHERQRRLAEQLLPPAKRDSGQRFQLYARRRWRFDRIEKRADDQPQPLYPTCGQRRPAAPLVPRRGGGPGTQGTNGL